MNIIYPENISKNLKNKISRNYFLFGENLFLIRKSIKSILRILSPKNIYEIKRFRLISEIDLKKIIEYLSFQNLFYTGKIIIINVLNESFFLSSLENLINRSSPSWNQNLILIMIFKRLYMARKIRSRFESFTKIHQEKIIDCSEPNRSRLFKIVKHQMESRSIWLDLESIDFILDQVKDLTKIERIFRKLSNFFLNKTITINQIKNFLRNEVSRSISEEDIIYELLLGKIEKTWRKVESLKKKENDIFKLIKSIQNRLILLFFLKYETIKESSTFFISERVNRRFQEKYESYIKKIDQNFILSLMKVIARSELFLKNNDQEMIWLELERIIILFANQKRSKNDT
ncbi:DNA polymerase III subunit delta [Candidatus Riesia pediculicola]|uniref:DNA polymerase III subunit delta n=1 Tax=Riesia pediculicola (strain USDA) TaxID=515618 RepID=D4G7P5_RIEPU|nr:DNA polymerase III, delta subunit superfamily [Candidatus Riesia pediculicola USDA]ARC53620.1 hypothetical protein AOE55_00410 [Candidatus Riesia pediculicola]